MIDNINFSDLKNIYNTAINSLIGQDGLAVPCKVIYNSSKQAICSNCIFDPISQRSSNMYNNTGPAPFAPMGICPVCNGYGIIDLTPEETVYLAILFDSKYWLNWDSKSINITNNMAQSISNISLLPKLQNAKEIIIDTTIAGYGHRRYSRVNDPEPCGLGHNNYIITMWQKIL